MTYRQATEALVNASNDPAAQRKLIRLAGTQEKIGAFGRGDFGYLTPTTGSLPAHACGPITGAGIGQAIAASRPPTCLQLSGVDLQPANDQVAMDGLNTRFDIYANGFESCKDELRCGCECSKGIHHSRKCQLVQRANLRERIGRLLTHMQQHSRLTKT